MAGELTSYWLSRGLGSVAGGWSPYVLGDSLIAWWDSAFGVTVSGAQVTSWTDRKAGLSVTQSTSSRRPTWTSTSFNGFPGLTWDGVDDVLNLESCPFPVGSSASMVWCVAQQDAPNSDAGGRRAVSYGDVSASARYLRRFQSAGESRIAALAGDGAQAVSSGSPSLAVNSRHVFRGLFLADGVRCFADGIASPLVAVVPATVATRFNIGASSSSAAGSEFWLGQIRDVIVTTDLNAPQTTLLQSYLANRRAL